MSRYFFCLFFMLFGFILKGQTSLQYTLKKGDRFVIEQVAEQYITQDFDGQSHEMENNINGVMEFNVATVSDEGYELIMTFLDLGMRINSNMQGEIMKVSARELIEGDVQSQIFHSLLHVPLTISLKKSGKVSSIRGVDSLIVKMTEASGLTDSIAKETLAQSLRTEFGSEALSNSFEQMTYFYPDQDESQPSEWTNEYSGKLSAKNSWLLEKASDSVNLIKGTAEIVMNVDENGTQMLLNGTQQTTISAYNNSGLPKDMSVEGSSEGKTVTTLTGNLEIPTTVRSKTTYKLIEDYHVQ